MSEIISGVRFAIPNVLPAMEISADQWADGLKTNALRINEKRQIAIPDEGVFQLKLAERAGRAFQSAWAGSSFISKSGLSAATFAKLQLGNLKKLFRRWEAKSAKPFATVDGIEAKIFKEAVDESIDHWSEQVSDTTLRFTGDVREAGAAVLAGFWLTDDNRVITRAGDVVINGGPVNVTSLTLRKNLRSALVQQLTQSGVAIVQTNYDAAVTEEQNAVINDLIKRMQEPTYVEFQKDVLPDKSFCVYRMLNGQLYLEIQVVTP
jgi:hypothetical protein